MKKIAVITGASSGIGKEFAATLQTYGTFDEVWVIARRLDRLEALKEQLAFPVRPIALDLSDEASYASYAAFLEEEKPNVALLVNCSGFGKFEAVSKIPLSDNLDMVKLNCMALMAMCQLTEPYMQRGAQIINIASVAAYQPIPYINVYGASKSFVLHFSRALNRELRSRGIRVLAVCPFWTKTEFFNRAVKKDEEAIVKKYIAMYEPKDIVALAWKDAKRGKDVSMYGVIARGQTFLAKILPHSFIMSVWMKQQRLK